MKKLKEIFSGWWNYFFRNEEIEKLSESRMKICNDCEIIDRTGIKCALPGSQPCCGDCGCPLSKLTRSKESTCPLNKW